MISAGIIGGAGYTGGEMIRILLGHPKCKLSFVQSNSQAGKAVTDIHKDLTEDTDLVFTETHRTDADVLFLCVAHGDAVKFLKTNKIPADKVIIDLSQDFRLKPASEAAGFIYGLPEAYRDRIRGTKKVANPGCFATAIELAALPLANRLYLNEDVHVTAITGSTGAGQSLSETVHFTWRNSNVSFYKIFEHQHLSEIRQTITEFHPAWNGNINFVPVRGNFTRGILCGLYTKTNLTIKDAEEIYSEFYSTHPFTIMTNREPDIKQVINTNKCLIYLKKIKDQLFVTSVIDNLLKGASGQAVQNMNLIFGWEERCGLSLKPAAF